MITENTKGNTKSRGDIADDVRQKLGNPIFSKIIKIIANTKAEELPVILRKIEGTERRTFVVGEVFEHEINMRVPQYHWENFKKILQHSKDTKIIIEGDMFDEPIFEYHYNDKYRQNSGFEISPQKLNSMDENTFWAVLYLLIVEPDLGKKILKYELQKDIVYSIFLKEKENTRITIKISFNTNKWSLDAKCSGSNLPRYPRYDNEASYFWDDNVFGTFLFLGPLRKRKKKLKH